MRLKTCFLVLFVLVSWQNIYAQLEEARYKLEYQPTLLSDKVVIEISGKLIADRILLRDTLRSLEILENVSKRGMFTKIYMEKPTKGEFPNSIVQRWVVTGGDGKVRTYLISFTPSPQGGTDITIMEEKKNSKNSPKIIIDIR